MRTNHTPTPWKAVEHNWSTIGIYSEDERCGGTVAVLDIQAEATEGTQADLETWMAANADLIVKAVNSHDLFVKAAKAALTYDEAIHSCADDPNKMSSFCTAEGDDLDTLYFNWLEASKAALAAAGAK